MLKLSLCLALLKAVSAVPLFTLLTETGDTILDRVHIDGLADIRFWQLKDQILAINRQRGKNASFLAPSMASTGMKLVHDGDHVQDGDHVAPCIRT